MQLKLFLNVSIARSFPGFSVLLEAAISRTTRFQSGLKTSSERSPSVTPSQLRKGPHTMARTPGNRARRRLVHTDGIEMRGGKSLHVDVPTSANVDVLKILDAVPFTPSQGVRTPSPRNMAALRTTENSDFGPSRLSLMEKGDSAMPSPPYSPTFNSTQFDLYGMMPSPPFSPTYSSMHYDQAAMPDAKVAMEVNGQMRGQLLHQMYFGYSGSPPSPSDMTGAWQPSTSPAGYNSSSPTEYVQIPSAYQQAIPSMFAAPQLGPQQVQVPSVYGHGVVAPSLFPADLGMVQPFVSRWPGGTMLGNVPMPHSSHSMIHNPVQHRAHQGPSLGGRRNQHASSRFRTGSAGPTNNLRQQQHQHPSSAAVTQLQTYAIAQARAQNLRQNTSRASPDSSPNSSGNGSPNAPQSSQGNADSGKPRMNARQRRTERRRRERDIKAITDHMADLQTNGGGIAGEDRRLFDFQLSEVQTLMAQVQKQQQDTGEGVLIEYHLRKLRDLLKMDHPGVGQDLDQTLSDETSPNNTKDPAARHGTGSVSPDYKSSHPEGLGDLDAKFKETLDIGNSKVPPADPAKGSASLDDDSPMHPATPHTQAKQKSAGWQQRGVVAAYASIFLLSAFSAAIPNWWLASAKLQQEIRM
eukprot:scaffold132410_cov46-Prasinocladus_malaysianus.AAC.2